MAGKVGIWTTHFHIDRSAWLMANSLGSVSRKLYMKKIQGMSGNNTASVGQVAFTNICLYS